MYDADKGAHVPLVGNPREYMGASRSLTRGGEDGGTCPYAAPSLFP